MSNNGCFERLVKELRRLSIVDLKDKYSWNEQVNALEKAWRWGKKADMQHHATQILIQAKKYKEFELFCYTPLLFISEGETIPGYVADRLFFYPWSERSSKKKTYDNLLKENKDFVKRSPYELSDEKSKYEKLKIEMDIMRHSLMVQLCHEKKRYEKLEKDKENNYFLKRLSQQLSEENKKYEQLKNETEEMLERLSEQLSHKKKHYEKLLKEKDELLNSLSEQLRYEGERHEKEKDTLLKRLSQQPREEKNKNERLNVEKEEMHKRFSQQLSDERSKYEQLKIENDEMRKRLSQQPREEKNKNERLNVEKDESHKRFSQQLSDERSKYEQLKIESDEMHKSLSAQLSNKQKQCEKLEEEKEEMLNSVTSLSEKLGHEKKQYETIENEKDEFINRLSKQLSDEKNEYERLKKEKDEKLESLLVELSSEREQYEKLEKEKDNLMNRLSQHVSAKLTQGNPDITDLSDIYRPSKLGELYSELYDNEWTDAYEWLTETFDEKEAIKILLDVLTTSYSYCLRHSKNQQMLFERLAISPISTMSEIEQSKEGDFFEHMTKSVLTGRQALGDIEQKLMADFQKGTKVMSVENVVEEGVNAVMSRWEKSDPSNHFRSYVQQCLRICWFMCQQSPRMFIEVDIAKYSGATFNKSTFKEYVKTGKNIDYVVWLPLFLHEGGNLIRKGVANGK